MDKFSLFDTLTSVRRSTGKKIRPRKDENVQMINSIKNSDKEHV